MNKVLEKFNIKTIENYREKAVKWLEKICISVDIINAFDKDTILYYTPLLMDIYKTKDGPRTTGGVILILSGRWDNTAAHQHMKKTYKTKAEKWWWRKHDELYYVDDRNAIIMKQNKKSYEDDQKQAEIESLNCREEVINMINLCGGIDKCIFRGGKIKELHKAYLIFGDNCREWYRNIKENSFLICKNGCDWLFDSKSECLLCD